MHVDQVGGEFQSETSNYDTIITILMDFISVLSKQQARQSFCSVLPAFPIILSFFFFLIFESEAGSVIQLNFKKKA